MSNINENKDKNEKDELKRFLIELKFVEEYHWLPQDIRNIPYEFMKMHFVYDG